MSSPARNRYRPHSILMGISLAIILAGWLGVLLTVVLQTGLLRLSLTDHQKTVLSNQAVALSDCSTKGSL
ncbi:MAG: hypothetical protein ACRDFX_09180, partial [Chloroflexota bacterium]